MLSRAPLLNFHFREITLVLITEASFLYTWFCYKSLTGLKLSGMHWLPCPTCWDAMPIPKLTLMGCSYLKEGNGPGSHLAEMQMTHFSSSVFLQSLEPRSQSFTWFRELLVDLCSWTGPKYSGSVVCFSPLGTLSYCQTILLHCPYTASTSMLFFCSMLWSFLHLLCFYSSPKLYSSDNLPVDSFLILAGIIKECLSASERRVSVLCCFCRTRCSHKRLCLCLAAKPRALWRQGLNARYPCSSSALYGRWRSSKLLTEYILRHLGCW